MSWTLRDETAFFHATQGSLEIRLGDNGPLVAMSSLTDRSTANSLSVQLTPYDRTGSASETAPAKLRLGDAYVRQSDLIAVYPELPPCRFGYQVDVKCLSEADDCMRTEIWISVQTSLLDAHPQIGVKVRNEELESIGTGIWVSKGRRLAILVHPLDQSDCRLDSTSGPFGLQVFGRFMEKGVIRRMRFRLIASNSSQDNPFWMKRMEEFSDSPLPLTT